MATISGDIYIERTPDEVFDFVADERNEPAFNDAMTEAHLVTEPPIGIGTRFDTTVRSRSRGVHMSVEYTAYEPPTRLASTSTAGGMTLTGELRFTPEGSGTRMSWCWNVRPSGALRLAAPLIKLIGQRQERRTWSSLKKHLEAQH